MTSYPLNMSLTPQVQDFFDPASNTFSYIVSDPDTKKCAVIDPVLDIDYAAGRIYYEHADQIIKHIEEHDLQLEWLIETHVHADHLSAAPYIQGKIGGKIGIGEFVQEVQECFGKIFNEGTEFERDGSQFDQLFSDGDTYTIGSMQAFVIHTPGHTPACMVHVIGNCAFVGDTLFMPDSGSARADFPGGDAGQLYDSIQKVMSLPEEMNLYMCHDYGAGGGREVQFKSTVGEEKANNIHIGGGKTREEFIKFRTERDAQLSMPKLIVPSVQVNMRGGKMPEPENEQGQRFFKVPINGL